MANHFRLSLLIVLVLVITFQDCWTPVDAISPAQSPGGAPRSPWSALFSASAPGPRGYGPPPPPPPPPSPPTHLAPPPSGSGGSSGLPSPKTGGGGGSLSGGQKAGIVVGVLAGAGLIGFATMVYMKRRSNVRRARFGLSARRSQL